MANIDRSLNIYQSYSLAKISALNKKSLAMQYAQSGEINKLEKSISRELRAVNKLNRQILENQLKEIKHKETIKFYRKIAFEAKEAVEIINSQEDLIFRFFLCEIYAQPLKLLFEDAKNNLEEISDKEYCSLWSNKLESTVKAIQSLQSDFYKSSYYVILSERNSYDKAKQNIEEKRELLCNERNKLTPPDFMPLKEMKGADRLSGGCIGCSVSFFIFGLLVFVANLSDKNVESDLLSLGLFWIAFPVVLVLLAFLIKKKKKREYPIKMEKLTKENEEISNQNAAAKKEFEDKLSFIDEKLNKLNEEQNLIESQHPYSVALIHINQETPGWEAIIEKIEKYIPRDKEEKTTKSIKDPLYEEIKNLVIGCNFVSGSMIQRRYGLSYRTASNIVDKLEAEGVVGPSQNGKHRVLLKH